MQEGEQRKLLGLDFSLGKGETSASANFDNW